ncbi:TAXI family TRAP transporter solute-binding subunit [Oricola thermophila]|uniref:TAXI family TRAP transporter solute-binding subunit n=1 Tax=Oricola thermophila TaxID=2742145 RepID=A0A6N1V9P5_9HYPH|nr:TAXI family TRAP transporter solute-binding subunit [Oricola thermophila]QKV17243.1 TAXI family TRAP transporter solute-binding subunit [Oricola thermophila]
MLSTLRCFAAAAIIGLGTATATHAETYSLEGAGTASLTGIVPQALASYANREGVDVQVVLGQTLTKSALKVAAGQLDMAVIPPPALNAMRKGVGPYAQQGEKAAELSGNIRALFGFPGGTFHVIAWADSGIESWEDIKGKRVYVGPPAGAANAQMRGMIEQASGFKDGEDYEGIRAPWGAAQQAFQDGQFDVHIPSVAVGQQSINELGLQREIRIIGIPAEVVNSDSFKAYLKQSAVTTSDIPAGTYSGQVNRDEDLVAIATTMLLGVNKDLDEDVAYRVTKAYWDHLDEMKEQNALMRSIRDGEYFTNVNAPLHPGAIRYYEEKGIEIPEELRP